MNKKKVDGNYDVLYLLFIHILIMNHTYYYYF